MICIQNKLTSAFEEDLCRIGVPFKFYEVRNEVDDSKVTNWTSLQGKVKTSDSFQAFRRTVLCGLNSQFNFNFFMLNLFNFFTGVYITYHSPSCTNKQCRLYGARKI